jgi:hypothetical protein
MNDALIRLLLILIAAVTAITGLTQLVAPGFILGFIATTPDALGLHFFATVGMFMVILGAMFLQSLLNRSNEAAIPFWIGVQKIAAAILVSWAIVRGLLAPLAYLVAGFDAITGVIALIFWRRLPR